MKKLIVLMCTVLIFSCTNNNNDEVEGLKKQLSECEKENAELKQTPDKLLIDGKKMLKDGKRKEALDLFSKVCDKGPGTDYCKQASFLSDSVSKIIKQEQEEADRIKAQGFKALTESMYYENSELKMSFTSVSTGKTYTFDNYGTGYMYKTAERDNTFITASSTITSKSKTPNLPCVRVFVVENGNAEYYGTLDYHFVSWTDYGYYLGNYSDKRNDFAFTETIRFSMGFQMFSDVVKNKVIIVAISKKNDGYFSRQYSEFSNPPVSYSIVDGKYKTSLSAEEFAKSYNVIKIFNRNML